MGGTGGSTVSLPGSASSWRPPRWGRSSPTPGSGPAPRRDGPGWAAFLRSPARGILALDLFTADLLNGTKVYVRAVIEHGSRRVRVLGGTEHPVQSWVVRQARNLLLDLGDAGTRAKVVLHDRDACFTRAFDAVFQAAGIRVIRSAVPAPRMNSIMERWIGSRRRELLDRTLPWNQRHLMMLLGEYEDFDNSHRPHRALGQAAPLRSLPDGVTDLDHSKSGGMTARVASSTNIAWWHRFSAPTGYLREQFPDPDPAFPRFGFHGLAAVAHTPAMPRSCVIRDHHVVRRLPRR
jgi:transposase InsO family protein